MKKINLTSSPASVINLIIITLFISQHSLINASSPSFSNFGWQNSFLNNNLQKDGKKHDGEDVLEALLSEGEEKCYGKRCVQSDQCCPGSVCVDVDGITGTCLPIYGMNESEGCESDKDCETGLWCAKNPSVLAVKHISKTCQPLTLNMRKKQYNDECSTSQECDSNKGLCCQHIRRHRQSPRKLCYYFLDPKSCIGEVDLTHVKPLQHVLSNPFFKARIG